MLTISANPSLATLQRIADTVAAEIPNKYLPDGMKLAADEVLKLLKQYAPKRTGALAASLRYRTLVAQGTPMVEFWSDLPDGRTEPWWQPRTAYWQTRGTNTPITPVKSAYLRIPLPSGGFVYKRQVRGQRPNPFDQKAAQRAGTVLEPVLEKIGAMIVSRWGSAP